MLAEIVTIGDEILIGQIVDTNSAWMGTVLSDSGIKVHQITSVSDSREHILKTLKEASQRADIILITGALAQHEMILPSIPFVNTLIPNFD
jgi:nicotinamide-nucleotide amidase